MQKDIHYRYYRNRDVVVWARLTRRDIYGQHRFWPYEKESFVSIIITELVYDGNGSIRDHEM